MKPASGGLITLMTPGSAAKQWVHADLYTWTLVTGAVSRYTSADIDLVISGNTFSSANALFKRGKTQSQLGIQVPQLEIDVFPRAGDLISGVGWVQAARTGVLDGATVLVERFLSDSWTNLAVGSLYQFFGAIGNLDWDRSHIKVTLVAPTKVLNQKLPRNTFQATCLHTLYDTHCTVNKGAKTVSGVVASGSTTNLVNSNRTEADNYFNLGVITFTSGVNSGLQRSVDAYTNANGQFSIPFPLPAAPQAGDTFSAYPGCNKLYGGDCLGKFNNQPNFKATPFIPVAEDAL